MPAPRLLSLSVDTTDESRVRGRYATVAPATLGSTPIPGAAFTPLLSLPAADSLFTVTAPDSLAYYQLQAAAPCGPPLVSAIFRPVRLLSAAPLADSSAQVQLRWTRYVGAPLPISYTVETRNGAPLLTTADTSAVLRLHVAGTTRLRIRATGADGRLSFSNSRTVRVAPALTVPNILTPNGDGLNERLVVTNLRYYPGTRLEVYNRWGRRVFEAAAYTDEWDAAGLAGGVALQKVGRRP